MKIDEPDERGTEYHSRVLRRTRQTLAVLKVHQPALLVAHCGVAELAGFGERVSELVGVRDTAEVAFREARLGFLAGNRKLRMLSLKVPLLIEGHFQKGSAIVKLLPGIWALVPRTPALVMRRVSKVLAVWISADKELAARTPPEPPVVRESVGVAEFALLVEAQAGLEGAMEDAAAALRSARGALRGEARALDRLNKRFFGKLKAEARSDAALLAGLGQITTEASGRGKASGRPAVGADLERTRHGT